MKPLPLLGGALRAGAAPQPLGEGRPPHINMCIMYIYIYIYIYIHIHVYIYIYIYIYVTCTCNNDYACMHVMH